MISIFSPFSSPGDVGNTRTAGTNACTDRIDVLIVRNNSDLGAVACLTRDGLDLDDTGVDLRHLQLKQTLNQTRVGAGNNDLRAAGAAANLDEVNLQALTLSQDLTAHLLGSGQNSLALLAAGNNIQISGARSAGRCRATTPFRISCSLLSNSEITMPRSASRMP